jgi:hypothetical protein
VIETWLRAIRDHPHRPPALQRHSLAMLALRLDDRSGQGFCSTAQVMADADASKSTVMRATKWGRGQGFLLQTKRGHRIDSERVSASEWRLCHPTQGVMGEPLAKTQGVNGQDPRCQQRTPNKSPIHQERGAAATAPNGAPPRNTETQRVAILAAWEAGQISTEQKRDELAALAPKRRRSR